MQPADSFLVQVCVHLGYKGLVLELNRRIKVISLGVGRPELNIPESITQNNADQQGGQDDDKE